MSSEYRQMRGRGHHPYGTPEWEKVPTHKKHKITFAEFSQRRSVAQLPVLRKTLPTGQGCRGEGAGRDYSAHLLPWPSTAGQGPAETTSCCCHHTSSFPKAACHLKTFSYGKPTPLASDSFLKNELNKPLTCRILSNSSGSRVERHTQVKSLYHNVRFYERGLWYAAQANEHRILH